MNNKIGSTRTINVDTNVLAGGGLIYINDEKLHKRSMFKVCLDDNSFKQLDSWDKAVLNTNKPCYSLARKGGSYLDYAFVKLRMGYDTEKKVSLNVVKTKVLHRKKELKDLPLEELNELLRKSKQWQVVIKAVSVYMFNNKKGIKYMVEQVNID